MEQFFANTELQLFSWFRFIIRSILMESWYCEHLLSDDRITNSPSFTSCYYTVQYRAVFCTSKACHVVVNQFTTWVFFSFKKDGLPSEVWQKSTFQVYVSIVTWNFLLHLHDIKLCCGVVIVVWRQCKIAQWLDRPSGRCCAHWMYNIDNMKAIKVFPHTNIGFVVLHYIIPPIFLLDILKDTTTPSKL
jgi:hypothetical protein